MSDAVDGPAHVLLPRKFLAVRHIAIGTGAGAASGCALTASIEDSKGKPLARAQQDFSTVQAPWIAIPLRGLEPGSYTLRLRMLEAKGACCSEWTQPIEAVTGPLD
jgi:hypothetical protein